MIERINDFLAKHFGGVGTTRSSLVRIHVWAIVFLLLASAVVTTHDVPRQVRARIGPVQLMNRDPSDHRAFTPSAFGDEAFHVAWIFSSEGYIKNPKGGIPSLMSYRLREALPEIDGRPVVVDTYGLLGMGPGDLQLALKDALAEKPDLVLLSLNPLWVMNPIGIHRWSQLDPRGAVEMAGQPDQWPLGAALFSPADLLWGLTESQLTPIRERSYWSTRVHDLVDDLGPLDRSQLAAAGAARRPDAAQKVLGMQPVTFWLTHRFHIFSEDRVLQPGLDDWTRWVDMSNQGDNPFNGPILRAIGTDLRAAKVPTIVYLAQVNTEWLGASKACAAAGAGVERQHRDHGEEFDAPTIVYQPETLSRKVSGLTFSDGVHVTDPGTIGPYLADRVCRLLTRVDPDTACAPVVEGDENG